MGSEMCIRDSEMVVTLDDFMRRRSKIDLVVSDQDILGSPGLTEVSEILFGADAGRRLAEYVAAKQHASVDNP